MLCYFNQYKELRIDEKFYIVSNVSKDYELKTTKKIVSFLESHNMDCKVNSMPSTQKMLI